MILNPSGGPETVIVLVEDNSFALPAFDELIHKEQPSQAVVTEFVPKNMMMFLYRCLFPELHSEAMDDIVFVLESTNDGPSDVKETEPNGQARRERIIA